MFAISAVVASITVDVIFLAVIDVFIDVVVVVIDVIYVVTDVYMSATLNTLFRIVLINLSKDFLNILYDSELRISKLNLFHSLIV